MIPQVRGFQGCYLDHHRNNWRCARAVPTLCENAPKHNTFVCARRANRGPVVRTCGGTVHRDQLGASPLEIATSRPGIRDFSGVNPRKPRGDAPTATTERAGLRPQCLGLLPPGAIHQSDAASGGAPFFMGGGGGGLRCVLRVVMRFLCQWMQQWIAFRRSDFPRARRRARAGPKAVAARAPPPPPPHRCRRLGSGSGRNLITRQRQAAQAPMAMLR